MAASDETIDPNDLDSIDALLDEAELEVTEKSVESPDAEQDAIDVLLDEADSEAAEQKKSSQEDRSVPEAEVDNAVDSVQEETPDLEKMKKTASEGDEASSKRVAAQSNPNTEMTAEDMDSIKKLIIIFGSTLIVLILIGIGIGIWSALAAKGSGLDEETQTLIESIQVGTERVAVNVMDSNETIQAIEKKIDALNFQLEELATDLLEVQSTVPSTKNIELIDPLGLNKESVNPEITNPVKVPVSGPAVSSNSQSDPEAFKLANSMNKKMISAQRRIDEVNRRVKDIQAKHKTLLLSVKNLEKQLILQQKQVASKEKIAKEQKQAHNPYQYSAPGDAYYDQSVGDSYP